jgi:hypothetical protein
MSPFRTLVATLLLLPVAGAALAQGPREDPRRGSTPPGASQDGSRPIDGAIRGGSIAPEETRGGPVTAPPRHEVERCYQLEGALREGCLRDLGGGTPPPKSRSRGQ